MQDIEYAQYKAQNIKNLFVYFNRPNIKILDFGCDSGLMTYYLQEVFFESMVIGVDQSENAIQKAQQTYPEIKFQSIENNKLSFPDNYFDVVIAADTFHHIPQLLHQYWIQELKRILKPSGYFVLLELNPWNWSTAQEFKKNPEEKNAQMLSPRYANNLLSQFGNTKINFYNFFSKLFSFLGFCEPYLVKIPLGAIYIIVLQKD